MLDFEVSTKFRNHSIVDISSIVSDVPFKDTVTTYEVMLNESGYNVFRDRGK